jgi:voltage-gated potassium channel
VFLLGSLFLVGIVEVATSDGDTKTGVWLIGVAWVGFFVDLVVLWVLDDNPASYPKRHPLAFIAVLVPAFRALMVFYAFVRLARDRVRLQTRVQLYALYLTILVVTFGAALVLMAERSYPGSSIHTYGEAVWWAAVTVTTVGYGDYVPVSPLGRGIATLMLVNGVVIISVITATVSSRFVSSPDPGERAVTLDDLDDRLARIEAALMLRTATTSAEGDDEGTDDETASPS